ncbi:LamG domain-containing protein [Candidatus Nitrosotenuis uzonensis]|nr:LamG domain-containing protein [Candidatus Nitrosotenuis uzonensis]
MDELIVDEATTDTNHEITTEPALLERQSLTPMDVDEQNETTLIIPEANLTEAVDSINEPVFLLPVNTTDSITTANATEANTPLPTNTVTPTSNSTTLKELTETLQITGNTPLPTNTVTPTSNSTTLKELTEDLSMIESTPDKSLGTVIVPDATRSWGSNSTEIGSQLFGQVAINQTGIVLEGGFIKYAGNNTNHTSNIAVAAWLKPDYSSDTSKFTIISKEKTFELTLNNILYPQHKAIFSVFDGIKWHQIQTNSEIGQNWTHIAATFNGTNISIYVNGTLSNTKKTTQSLTVDSTGTVQKVTPSVSSTDSDVAIGAALDGRKVDNSEGIFSGSLDYVEIYDSYLTPDQILKIYSKTLPSILSKLVIVPNIEKIELDPINLLNQTNINGTLNTNMTQFVSLPTLNQTNQITISAWVDPIYNQFSDEFTIVSMERSFSLSINNVIDPKRTAVFSVFDGIRWTDVYGTSKIENPSHIAAVVNGTRIFLYVNGELQASKILSSSFSMSNGKLDVAPAEMANTDSDIIIGAYMYTRKGELYMSNKFSGIIENAIIYNRSLSSEEIKQLYLSEIKNESKQLPLFTENILSFTDIVTLTLIPKVTTPTNYTQIISESLQITESTDNTSIINELSNISLNENLGMENVIGLTSTTEPSISSSNYLGLSDSIELVKNVLPSNNTIYDEMFGIADSLSIQKLSPQITADSIIFEERGKDYYKVEYENGTGQITFGLPEWILDPSTNKYVEHIVTETPNEIIYDSMQIPFVFDKADCSVRIYEKGKIDANSQLAIGKKYWKLMEAQAGSNQWIESQINKNSCNIQVFSNSTGFFINAIRENKDGTFITTYGKKVDQPLESFLYYTNKNPEKTNTKYGFVNELENIESDEADLGDEIITSKPEIAQKFADKARKQLKKLLNDMSNSEVKELRQNEKLSKKKPDMVTETIEFKKTGKASLAFDFSKASKEFSNINLENRNGKLKTTVEFLEIAQPLQNGETAFLDPTVVFSSGTFVQVQAPGTTTNGNPVCKTPATVSQPSQSRASITRTNNANGCYRTAVEYNISSIDSRAVITDVKTSFTTASFASTRTCEVRAIEIRPTSHTLGGTQSSPEPDAQILWDDIGNGTQYATGIVCAATSGGPIDLGSGADNNLQTAIDNGQTWFALGWKLDDEVRPTVNPSERGSLFSAITMTVTYNFKAKLSEKLGIKDSISFTKNISKQFSDKLGMRDLLLVNKHLIKTLTENLGITKTVISTKIQTANERLGIQDTITVKKTTINLNERLGILDANVGLTRQVTDLHLTERLGLTDSLVAGKAHSVSLLEKLGIRDAIKITRNIFLTEKLGFNSAITTQKFPGIEFNTQNGCTIISNGSTSKTLFAGTDYTDPQGEAFVRIVDTRQQGIGRTSGGGTQNADRVTAYISDPDFAGGSITFTRAGTTNDDRICWQIVDYQGSPTSANAIKVRQVGTVTHSASGLTVDTPTVSGVVDDNDIFVFITGQSSVHAGSTRWSSSLNTAEWLAASDTARFTRGISNSNANPLSYAIVEFTGSNWSVQRIQHGYTATSAQTVSISDVGSIERAFFQYQHRSAITSTGLDEAGSEVYFSATNQITFDLEDTASPASSITGVAWVVSNSQTGPDAMIVQHKSGTRSGAGSEEFTQNISISTVRSLSTTSIMGENTRSSGTGTGFPVGHIAFNLTSTNNVVLITSDSANTQNYRFQVVQWPIKPSKTFSVSLNEKLGITDTIIKTSTIFRTEKLGISDVITTPTRTQSLTESLGMKDTVFAAATRTQSLTESLGITDTVATSITQFQSLTESLGMKDTVFAAATRTQSLTESLGITDNTAKTASKSLTESLGITDNTAKTVTKSLTENLGMTDNAARTANNVKLLSERLGVFDVPDDQQQLAVLTKSLRERLGMSDTILFKGGAKIEARDLSNNLVPGASYTVYPNPTGGNTPLLIVDNVSNDNDSIPGRVTFDLVPFGTYNFTMTVIPSTYNVLGNSTIHEVHRTQINGTAVFRVSPQSTPLSTIAPTVITTAPSLNSTVYDKWTSTYSATIVNGTSTHVIDKVQDLPPIISVGKDATTLLNSAITKQASVKLSISFSSLSSGKTIQNTIGIQNYSVPESPEITSVIPSIVTAPSGTSPQFVMTPPMNKIIPGQTMILPVETDLMPSWGGLKQLSVQSKDGVIPTAAPGDWLVIESAPTVPSAVGTNGISNNVRLFVEVKYRHAEDGIGYDWSQTANHKTKPVLKVQVAKSSSLASDANGCPVLTGYMFDTTSNTWKTQGIQVGNAVSINTNTCELDLTVDHFSRFSLSAPSSGTTGPSGPGGSPGTPGGSTGSGGGSSGGGGAVGTAGTTGQGFGGRLIQPIIIYQITYDVCDTNMARIIIGVHGTEAPAPAVKIRTPQKEVYTATLAREQPYLEANKILQISRYVYEAPLDPNLNFFIVTAEQAEGRTAVSASYLANIYQCRETIIVNPMRDLDKEMISEPTVEAGRPNIFDIKFQVGGSKPVSAYEVNQYVEHDAKIKFSSILDSPTTIQRAELRVITAGDNYTDYAAVRMNVVPLQNITNTYIASAEIPSSFLQAPAIIYWIHVINEEQKIQTSDRYFLGVKPTYDLDARIELDTTPSKAQGTTYKPTAYIFNKSEKPLFGSVSLVIDGKIVYTSPEQLFNNGQSVVNLEWKVPNTQAESEYSVKAQINLYDMTIETAQATLRTFQETRTYSISEPVLVNSVVAAGEMVARVGLLYSSDVNPSLHYRVVSPDGTCVIGQSDSCMVNGSTAGNRGNSVSVELEGQVYRIRYSGQDNPLERFSITSIDPIVGNWSITLESDGGLVPEAHATEDIQVKAKYRATYTKLLTMTSE